MTASVLEGFSIEVMPRTLAKIDNLATKIKNYLANQLNIEGDIKLVGTHLLFSNQHRPIVDGLKRSLLIASTIIFIIFWISSIVI